MQDEEFEWDEGKAASNHTKHRVSFEVAREAFVDPNFIEEHDPHPFEERYNRICMREGKLYVVNYTERGLRFRIMSARPATRHEHKLYYDR